MTWIKYLIISFIEWYLTRSQDWSTNMKNNLTWMTSFIIIFNISAAQTFATCFWISLQINFLFPEEFSSVVGLIDSSFFCKKFCRLNESADSSWPQMTWITARKHVRCPNLWYHMEESWQSRSLFLEKLFLVLHIEKV